MIATMDQADEEMAELFRLAWEIGKGYKTDWPNQKTVDHLGSDTWARWSLDYVGGRQRTFAKKGSRKFEKVGLIYMLIHTPLGKGLASARVASEVAIAAYEGERTPGGVTFRNVRIESEGHGRGSGGNKSWWETLVAAEFTYEHLR